jgi:type II secretory pathway pseudopilin PulG
MPSPSSRGPRPTWYGAPRASPDSRSTPFPATHGARSTPFRSTATRGYTAVEVLLAMTVMVIGAAGVMSMQKTSIQADLDARKMDVANGIARMWVERLERDAMQWTLPSSSAPGAASNLASTKIIGPNIDRGWFVPNGAMSTQGATPGSNTVETMGYAFDILGRDLAVSDVSQAVFCVNTQIVTLISGQLYRGDVRVLWLRGFAAPGGANGFCNLQNADFTANDPNASNAAGITYRAIYTTTSIRENAQ